MMKETVDIVKELISQLDIIVKFKSIVDNGDGTYTVTTCNTGYLFPCYKFTLDSVNYTVQEEGFIFNEQFKIKGNVIPSATELVIIM